MFFLYYNISKKLILGVKMKRPNKIKRKEYCKFLIKAFAIKNNGFRWLKLNNIKIVLKPNIFLLGFEILNWDLLLLPRPLKLFLKKILRIQYFKNFNACFNKRSQMCVSYK